MSTRVRKTNKIAPPKKQKYFLNGGPWSGDYIYLTAPETTFFSVTREGKKFKGRYIHRSDGSAGKVIKKDTLIWEAAPDK